MTVSIWAWKAISWPLPFNGRNALRISFVLCLGGFLQRVLADLFFVFDSSVRGLSGRCFLLAFLINLWKPNARFTVCSSDLKFSRKRNESNKTFANICPHNSGPFVLLMGLYWSMLQTDFGIHNIQWTIWMRLQYCIWLQEKPV